MKRLLRSRTEPAEVWSPEHERLRASLAKLGIVRDHPHPEWLVVEILVEDVEGLPAGIEIHRAPVLSSSPMPSIEVWHEDEDDERG